VEAESTLEGEPLRIPPSNGRPIFIRAPCLPFSGRVQTPALRPKGHTPLEPPTIGSAQQAVRKINRSSTLEGEPLRIPPSNGIPYPAALKTISLIFPCILFGRGSGLCSASMDSTLSVALAIRSLDPSSLQASNVFRSKS